MIKYIKSLLLLLDSQDKRRIWFLGFFIILAAFIELIGVGSLFPFIKVLSDTSLIHSNQYLKEAYSFFSFSSNTSFLIFMGSVIFMLIVVKAGATFLNSYWQAKFTARINNKLSKKLLLGYLGMNYAEFLQTNSATLSKHLLLDIRNVISVISNILSMVTNGFVGIVLITLMMWVDLKVVLASVLVLLLFLQLTASLTKSRLRKLAKSNESHNRKVYQAASNAFLGIKDIKIFGVENYFLSKYNASRKVLSSQVVEAAVISSLPAVIMNVVGFGVLLSILLYLLSTKGNVLNVLPVIGVIAICIQRLLPIVNSVSSSVTMIRKFRPVVFIIKDALGRLKSAKTAFDSTSSKKLTFNQRVLLERLSYKYPVSSELALQDVTIEITKNMSLGIVGTSGAGKSTLIDVLLGLYSPSKGKIYCDAVEVNESNISEFRTLIGYVPQKTFLMDASIKDNIAFGIDPDFMGEENLNQAVETAQLLEFVNQLPDRLDTLIGENGLKLSGGQRQRIGIARALYRNPEILVMDEATNSLDSATEKGFNDSLKALMKVKTIIIIAHRLSSVKFCDHLIQLEKGKIIASGKYDDLILRSDSFRKIYNINEPVDSNSY